MFYVTFISKVIACLGHRSVRRFVLVSLYCQKRRDEIINGIVDGVGCSRRRASQYFSEYVREFYLQMQKESEKLAARAVAESTLTC